MKISTRVAGLLGAVGIAATALTVAPVTNVVPAENQPVAEAAAVSRVHNWRFSDKPVRIYENTVQNGKGNYAWVHPGETVTFIGTKWTDKAHAEAIKLPANCRTELDPQVGPSKHYDLRGKKSKTVNFPLWMMGQSVITEVNC